MKPERALVMQGDFGQPDGPVDAAVRATPAEALDESPKEERRHEVARGPVDDSGPCKQLGDERGAIVADRAEAAFAGGESRLLSIESVAQFIQPPTFDAHPCGVDHRPLTLASTVELHPPVPRRSRITIDPCSRASEKPIGQRHDRNDEGRPQKPWIEGLADEVAHGQGDMAAAEGVAPSDGREGQGEQQMQIRIPAEGGLVLIGAISISAMFHAHASLMRPKYVADRAPSHYFAERFGISDRELEVVAALLRGLGNNEIAEQLFISPRTVENHLHSVYRKVGIKNRLQLFNLFRADEDRR